MSSNMGNRVKREIPEYQVVEGHILPKYNFDPNIFRECLTYKPRTDDVFIATYPKCGTTWTQQIVYLIFNNGIPAENGREFFSNSPFLERSGLDLVEKAKRPNAIKSHLPFSTIPYSKEAKYIYVTRNYKDCCVSFYHHTKSSPSYNFDGTLDAFFELFLDGLVDNGDYFEHLTSWYKHASDPNVLFLIYEQMLENPEKAILEVAKFLGTDYYDKLQSDNEALMKIVRFSEFAYMKQRTNRFFKEQYKYDHELVRKGNVGGWRAELTAEQSRLLDEKAESVLSGTELLKYWRDIGCLELEEASVEVDEADLDLTTKSKSEMCELPSN